MIGVYENNRDRDSHTYAALELSEIERKNGEGQKKTNDAVAGTLTRKICVNKIYVGILFTVIVLFVTTLTVLVYFLLSSKPCDIPPVDCGELPPIEHGSVILDKTGGTFYNDTATVTCNSMNKTYKITCTEAGSWETVSCTYMLVETKSNWWESKVACESLGGRLADIKSQAEQNVIEQIISTQNNGDGNFFWVGGSKSNSDGFVWLDGTAVSGRYTNWRPGEPNNKDACIMMSNAPYTWLDEPCEYLRDGGVCEFY